MACGASSCQTPTPLLLRQCRPHARGGGTTPETKRTCAPPPPPAAPRARAARPRPSARPPPPPARPRTPRPSAPPPNASRTPSGTAQPQVLSGLTARRLMTLFASGAGFPQRVAAVAPGCQPRHRTRGTEPRHRPASSSGKKGSDDDCLLATSVFTRRASRSASPRSRVPTPDFADSLLPSTSLRLRRPARPSAPRTPRGPGPSSAGGPACAAAAWPGAGTCRGGSRARRPSPCPPC